MKIAMMTNNYKPFIGGVPISIERLSESLRVLGHEVVVFAPTYEGQEESQRVFRYGSIAQGFYNGVSLPNSMDPSIEKKFKAEKFDVIHVHHPMLIGRTALYLAKKYKVPLVFTYHTRYEQYLHYMKLSCLKKAIPNYLKEYAKHCDVIAAPTPLMKGYLEEIGVSTPIIILPTGLQKESFLPDQEKVKAIRRQLIEGKKYLFCTVARLAKEKNIEFLIRSLSNRKNSQGNDFRLAVIGEGPQESHLRALTKEYGLEENIVFVGKVNNEDIKNYCAAADLFLFASTTETQGIVLLEAMAVKTPVLAVQASGTLDIVKNGINGYMTPVCEDIFSEQLDAILEGNEWNNLKQGAIETARAYETEQIARIALIAYAAAAQRKKEKSTYGRNEKYGILSGIVHRM